MKSSPNYIKIYKIKLVYLTSFLLLLPIASCNQITIKFKGTETEAFFINKIEGRECPDQITIDGILIPYSTCKYKFPNKIVTIGINWEKNITNFYRMFSDISNLKEIDLSGFNTSLVENMAYMFENCKSLIFANLSNVNINSVSNMQYMFSNCISLNSIDLTNVDIARISNKKNIFYNCINLKLDNILSIDNNKRQLGIDPEPYNQCDVNDFFNIDRECTINLEIADQKINEALTKESFMEFLSTTSFQSDDIISIEVENEIFSITRSSQRDTINLGVCEDELKNIYAIRANESLIIYIHEFKSSYFLIPIIGFEVFNNFTKLDLGFCNDILIQYQFEVNITEDNFYIHNPNSNYYDDNCSYISDISLYERKEYYNLNNLSLCQKDCQFGNYDSTSKKVTCFCPVRNTFINKNEELLHKFKLKDEDKNKCIKDPNEPCHKEDLFNGLNNCIYNGPIMNQEIKEGLTLNIFRESVSNILLNNKKEIHFEKPNDIYSFAFTKYDDNINLGECEILLREYYNLNDSENIIIYTHQYQQIGKKTKSIEYMVFNKNFLFNLSICEEVKIDIQIPVNINDEKPTISIGEFRNLISKNISNLVNSSSLINGENFKALILSSNDMNLKTQLQKGISAVDLGNCTQTIKKHYNISPEEDLIVLNIESMKTKNKTNESNIDNSFNLRKNVQVEIYDHSGRQLDLSVCKEDIKVLMNLANVEELNIQSSQKFSEQGIDVFNPTDNFFNDLCHKYENKDGIDIIIDDRRSDIYQNVTFCQGGCSYNGVDYDLMAANCLCNSTILQEDENNRTDDNNAVEKEVLNFKTLSKSFISSLLDFNIEVIYCYNLIFDTKILVKNIGFYCMITLNALQIIFLSIFLIKKLKPIKKFMSNFSLNKADKAYPPKKERKSKKDKNVDDINEIETKIEHDNKIKNKKTNIKKKERMQSDLSNFNSYSQTRLMISKNNLDSNNQIQNNNGENLEEILNINQNKDNKLFSDVEKDKKYSKGNGEDLISEGKNKNVISNKIKSKRKTKKERKKKKKKKINNIETKGEKDFGKNESDKKDEKANSPKTDDELDEMDYEEAIIYDKRPYIKMYWSSLLDSQVILDTFFTNNNLNLFIIKLSFFVSMFEISFFLNALFYTDDYISDAYHNNGVLDFVSGLPKSIYSFLATLILTNLLKMLSNSKSELMKLMKENYMDKEYLKLINAKLRKLKIKLIIYFIIVFTLGLFFLYYISAFCAVYRFSQKYWFYGFFESFGMDILTAFITCLILSFMKYVAIRKKVKCLYTSSNIIGMFL